MLAKDLLVLVAEESLLSASQTLADRLNVDLVEYAVLSRQEQQPEQAFFLCYRDGCLKLLDRQSLKKGGLFVDIEPRPGEQHSYPAPKKDLLALAIGKKSKTVIDATTGWAQDSLSLFRMGYDLKCIERSALMVELIKDGFSRLADKAWVQNRNLQPPELINANAINVLANLTQKPDCIYLDPMFPPKPKKSALAKKPMMILRNLLGDDLDRAELFNVAWQATAKRLVVKSPDYAEPIAGKPAETYQGKLLRFDVYIK